MRFKNMYTQN